MLIHPEFVVSCLSSAKNTGNIDTQNVRTHFTSTGQRKPVDLFETAQRDIVDANPRVGHRLQPMAGTQRPQFSDLADLLARVHE
jgi:hypothetical protein